MERLFQSFAINNITAKNRFFVAPMSRVSADAGGVPSEAMRHYYTAFAEGGFAVIISEGLYTDDQYAISYPKQPGLVNRQQVASWKKITTKVKQHGALFIAQLMHGGAISQCLDQTIAPSSIKPLGKKMSGYGGGRGEFPIPAEMTLEDIENVKAGFIHASLLAVEAGFDGIELHAANGYLLDQFNTSYLNCRTDAYGGNITNRFRIIQEVIADIKKVVPPHFIVGLRISEGKVNNLSYRWEGGSSTAIDILKEVRKADPHYLHIAAEAAGWRVECLYEDGCSSTGLAIQLLDCPVIANGGLHDTQLALHLLATAQADAFSIGKYAIANPDLPNKLKAGEAIIPFVDDMIKPDPSLFQSGYVLNDLNDGRYSR